MSVLGSICGLEFGWFVSVVQVSRLFPHNNDDARSKSLQIYNDSCVHLLVKTVVIRKMFWRTFPFLRLSSTKGLRIYEMDQTGSDCQFPIKNDDTP